MLWHLCLACKGLIFFTYLIKDVKQNGGAANLTPHYHHPSRLELTFLTLCCHLVATGPFSALAAP